VVSDCVVQLHGFLVWAAELDLVRRSSGHRLGFAILATQACVALSTHTGPLSHRILIYMNTVVAVVGALVRIQNPVEFALLRLWVDNPLMGRTCCPGASVVVGPILRKRGLLLSGPGTLEICCRRFWAIRLLPRSKIHPE